MDDSGDAYRDYRPHHLPLYPAARQSRTLRTLRKQTPPGECKVSTLRKSLKHPGTYLVLLIWTAAVVYADSSRPPDRQVSARAYIALVHSYQRMIGPALTGFVQCRFSPTCSRYSTQGVQRYGLRRGFALTAARLWRCGSNVPMGSHDPVP